MNKEYSCTINIAEDKINAINKLLNIEDLEDSSIGYQNEFENIYHYVFENGSSLYIDLCSGENNYYLQYQLYDKDQNVIEEDFMFDLEELEEIIDYKNNNKYVINFNRNGVEENE